MALIGNYTVGGRIIGRKFNNAVSGIPESISPTATYKNRFIDAFSKLAGTPNGYSNPGAWVLPLTAGGMSSYKQMETSIQTSLAILVAGINLDSNINGSIAITQAQLDQIANLTAAISGNINTTQAQLAAVSAMQASITASMTITNAQMGAIIDMLASLSGSFNLTNAGNFATAEIAADMSVSTGAVVTPTQIANEVFDNQDVETGYTLRKSLRLMLSALSGKISGAGTPTVTIRNVTDTKDRIVAGVDVDGNRTSITTDVD